MSTLYPVAGSKIYIGGVLDDKSSDFVEGDFGAQSWVEIDGWTQMGSFGDNAQLITTQMINRNRDVMQKGTSGATSMQNVFAAIDADQGQVNLIAASAPSNKNSYAFKILFPTGAIRYFIALVMSSQDAGGGANTINTLNATMQINSNIVRVAAP